MRNEATEVLVALMSAMLVYVTTPYDFERACEYAQERRHEGMTP